MFWRELKSFFYFRPKEKRGILVLSFFCLLIAGWRLRFSFVEGGVKEEVVLISEEVLLDTFPCIDLSLSNHTELANFGLSEKQIRTIENFQTKVRPINSFDDLYSLYHFDSSVVERLGSSLLWEKVELVEERRLLNLNMMSSKDFQKELSLSTKVCNRIVAYRKVLGGFYDLDQLCEVYYFPCRKIQVFSTGEIELAYSKVKQLSLNNSTFETLSKHPYIKKEQSKAIIKFRSEKNHLMKPIDLKKIKSFSKAEIKKLIPYLSD